MYQPFDQLPDSSRIWLYASTRRFSAADQEVIQKEMQDFCAGWATHGKEMPSSFEILHNQLLVLAVDESQLGASGCSIDSSVRALQALEQMLDLDLVNQGKVTFKNEEGVLRVVSSLGLKSKISLGEITPDLDVMQPSLQIKADLKSLWQPLRKSWLSNYFPN
ncbi:MAG: hypothetical protein O2829_01170 [Bacteroidetes bacterium]|nr:hypothetical protein [Bacteroidota bacterium]MDA1267691.1 hypothetical protein [Bacteroidota bacterium]